MTGKPTSMIIQCSRRDSVSSLFSLLCKASTTLVSTGVGCGLNRASSAFGTVVPESLRRRFVGGGGMVAAEFLCGLSRTVAGTSRWVNTYGVRV